MPENKTERDDNKKLEFRIRLKNIDYNEIYL